MLDPQGAVAERPGRVRDEQLRVEAVLDAQPLARRAGALRGVEREQPPRRPHARPGRRRAGRRAGAGGPTPRSACRRWSGGWTRLARWPTATAGPSPSMRRTSGRAEAADELARVGGQGLEEAPLPLPEEGVEGERGLARAGDAGDDGQAARAGGARSTPWRLCSAAPSTTISRSLRWRHRRAPPRPWILPALPAGFSSSEHAGFALPVIWPWARLRSHQSTPAVEPSPGPALGHARGELYWSNSCWLDWSY